MGSSPSDPVRPGAKGDPPPASRRHPEWAAEFSNLNSVTTPVPPPPARLSFEAAREWFPIFNRWVYLDFAGVAPVPQVAVEAATLAAEAQALDAIESVDDTDAAIDELRDDLARFVGADAGEIAFVRNTTEGLGLVANGLDLGGGDRVVVAGGDFPSAVLPWTNLAAREVQVDVVDRDGPGVSLDRLAEAVASGTPPAVVAVSWVHYATGWRTDMAELARICHERGALVCADVIQGVGAVPLDLHATGVDFAAAGGHKWLCSLEGQGFLYVARDALSRLRVLEPGWNSVVQRGEWEDLTWNPDPGARRLEGGSPTRVALAGLLASVHLLASVGIDRIWARVGELTDQVVRGVHDAGMSLLTARDPAHRSGIVTFTHPRMDSESLVSALRDRGVVVAPRAGGVRVSPHFVCDEGDLAAFFEALPR